MLVKHLIITGRVQGVFFRATAQEKALRLGVKGWITNNASGSVEAHLEGDDDAIRKLIDWCHTGPDAAEVENVQVTDCEAEDCTTFEILR